MFILWNDYWRASEASGTQLGVTNGNRRCMYIYVCVVRTTSL